jgi:aldose 1-epimerase
MKVVAAALAMVAIMSSEALAADARRMTFGALADGRAVEAVELSNSRGVSARVIAYGATLQALHAPDREGRSEDIVLGHDTLEPYVATPNYFGSTIGRYANRIAGGRFTLDGRAYTLAQNNGPNALHGGLNSFDRVLWRIERVRSGPVASVTLAYRSVDGEEGYPGALDVRVTYALNEENELSISYEARTDRATIVNLTNHSFFNLAGARSSRSALDQRLAIHADAFTPVDADLIPTGEIRSVANTVFDFRQTRVIGERVREASDEQIRLGRGYDHNWVLAMAPAPAPRLAARLEDPVSGRVLELLTTEPGVQFYTGNFLDGTHVGKGGLLYRQGDGVCLEPQRFPNSPNEPTFPSARLDRGEVYRQVSVFRLSTM